jgi:hypothetical protein
MLLSTVAATISHDAYMKQYYSKHYAKCDNTALTCLDIARGCTYTVFCVCCSVAVDNVPNCEVCTALCVLVRLFNLSDFVCTL